MPQQCAIQKFLDLLSQFSIVKKSYSGKRSVYSIPSLLSEDIPDLEKIKKLTNPYKIKISNNDYYELVLIF